MVTLDFFVGFLFNDFWCLFGGFSWFLELICGVNRCFWKFCSGSQKSHLLLLKLFSTCLEKHFEQYCLAKIYKFWNFSCILSEKFWNLQQKLFMGLGDGQKCILRLHRNFFRIERKTWTCSLRIGRFRRKKLIYWESDFSFVI